MKSQLIAIVAVSLCNIPDSFAYDSSDRQKSVKKNNNSDVGNNKGNRTNNAKSTSSSSRRVIPSRSSTPEEYRERLKQIANRNKDRNGDTTKGLPMPDLPFQGNYSKEPTKVNRTNTRQSNKTKTRDDGSNIIDESWLNKNYHLELNIEQLSDEGEKQIFNSKYILGKTKATFSDLIDYSSAAPITSELEIVVSEEISNKDELLISLFYGTRMPYKSSNNYTQFLDVGFTSGIRFKLGKSMTVWETKRIKLNMKVTPVD